MAETQTSADPQSPDEAALLARLDAAHKAGEEWAAARHAIVTDGRARADGGTDQ